MGYEVFVFNKNGHEIDFLTQKDGKEYLIQAAYSIAEEKTYQREFALFNTLDQSRRKIITTDEFDYSTSTVRHISLIAIKIMITIFVFISLFQYKSENNAICFSFCLIGISVFNDFAFP